MNSIIRDKSEFSKDMSYNSPVTPHGFTLVELLVALMVSSVILAAVATLAFAMTSAQNATDDTSEKQAQIRYATLRISELIRHCKMVCAAPDDDIVIWRSDDNANKQIDLSELVYIQAGESRDSLSLCDFPAAESGPVSLSLLEWTTAKSNFISIYDERTTVLLPQCSDIQFGFDSSPPQTRLVSISLNLFENNQSHQYQINARLLSWAGNLLNQAGDEIVSDDD